MRGHPVFRSLPLLLVATLFAASAQNAPPGLKKFSNRYEGLADRPNAKADYEVRGFFGYRQPDLSVKTGSLNVSYFVPNGAILQSFVVKELAGETQYEMLPILNRVPHAPGRWNDFNGWPVEDVLQPSRVDLQDLGVVLHMRTPEQPDLLAPVLLYSSSPPSAVDEYQLFLISRHELRSLNCTVVVRGKSEPCQRKPSLHAINTGMPVLFVMDAKELPQGPVSVVLHITGAYANDASGDGLDTEIHFIHGPKP